MKCILILILSILIISCAVNKDTLTGKITIASKKSLCMGVVEQECFVVKHPNSNEWELFYDNIEGFNYEKGNEYVLEVKKETIQNVPQDASRFKYVLKKIKSKTKKESENLPDFIKSVY